MRQVCVFCGSRPGADPAFVATARALGTAIAARGWGTVYGGGHVGLMGAVADAALQAGGEVIGVIPHQLAEYELAQGNLTRLEIVGTMHERKMRMADLSDAVIALPGGFGTLDELFEIVTWAQLGIHRKPVVLLDDTGFYRGLLAWLDTVVVAGLLRAEHRALILEAATPAAALDLIAGYAPAPPDDGWLRERAR